ncbi:hypothetical protein [Mesorhizobium sp. WSM2239]|uniref:Uncharacterized protein n=2 Tax=unclassified Mesorhizobium TaxID=325217 RepID=A0AAU8D2I1_9HYPH
MDKDELVRLRAAVAKLVTDNPIYVPVFDRLDKEVEALASSDPVARARLVVASQRAIA